MPKRNYAREAKDSSMVSFIVSSNQPSNQRGVQHITFAQDDAIGVYYPHYDALVVRIVVAMNGLKRMLVDNWSLVNIIYGATFDKMEVSHELTLDNLTVVLIYERQYHPVRQNHFSDEDESATFDGSSFYGIFGSRSTFCLSWGT